MNSPASIQLNNNGTLQDLFTVSDIVDFGNNSNGYYLRFANGIQICGHRDNQERDSGESYINVDLTYPAIFTEVFSVTSGLYTAMTQGAMCLVKCTISQTRFPTNIVNLILCSWNGSNLSSGNKTAGYLSLGRWK